MIQISLNRDTTGDVRIEEKREEISREVILFGLTSLHSPSVSIVDLVEIEKSWAWVLVVQS